MASQQEAPGSLEENRPPPRLLWPPGAAAPLPFTPLRLPTRRLNIDSGLAPLTLGPSQRQTQQVFLTILRGGR